MGGNSATAFAELDRETGSADEMLQLVSFKLGREEFAVDILLVQEINRMAEITPVPKASACVEGVINLRGKIIPVVNLRKRFGLEWGQATGEERIVVVNVQSRVIGLMVDSVSEVLRISTNTIEPPPSLVAGIGSEYVKGVGKLDERLLILLDLEMVLETVKDGEAAA